MTDSPWFWFFLFGGMALAGAFVIGPKHEIRQQRLVRMQGARDKVAQGVMPPEAGARPAASAPAPTGQLWSFLAAAWPLKLFLAAVLAGGAFVKTIVERRQRTSKPSGN